MQTQRVSKLLGTDSKFNHCASIAEAYGSYWLTYYCGAECRDEQRVVIERWSYDHKKMGGIELEAKTGNPVLIPIAGRLYILYSKFTDVDANGEYQNIVLSRPVERWKFCDNYLAEIRVDHGEQVPPFEVGDPQLVEWAHGLLARCNPLPACNIPGSYCSWVPMYRENDPCCCIGKLVEQEDGTVAFGNGGIFGEVGPEFALTRHTFSKLGTGVAIQPALFFGQNQEILALCRNVGRKEGDDCRAWLSVCGDGHEWSKIMESTVPSHNTSVATINYDGDVFVVYSTNRRRSDMWLHALSADKRIDLRIPAGGDRRSYSYPNMMSDRRGGLHVVHTNRGHIAWHHFEKWYIRGALGEDLRGRSRSSKLISRLQARYEDHTL